MATSVRPVGEHLRDWRLRRRLSQLDLALDAEISARHLSFVETGRARPSRSMLLRLAERLDMPLRERNLLLLAGGFAPAYPDRPLDDPALVAARRAIDALLDAHRPFPALAVDRHWTMIAANPAVALLLEDVDPDLLAPPANVIRLALHPQGLAPRILNFEEWRAHVLHRLRHQRDATGDPVLARLVQEVGAGVEERASDDRHGPAVVLPLRLASSAGALSFITTTTVFGTPLDVTLSEIALETFLPADEATAAALRARAG
ncbi:helix-turn-helix domain-containing protein [Sphingomonas lenta]|uniref:Transcriptional regulator n=1 Tax=Sphingomonas lenta TaxID=1141887 RepID=A0A2A2SBN5_9SPHN|nr:helix-turn-helix domain-containing protein [Sphingomonas lenta]PAX06582.1 transcriptional regulator [Sphingomonas lenta]